MPTHATAADEPLLISLAGVAELAGVRRPVASMWRTRSQRSDSPFPAAVAREAGRDMFNAEAVAAWLVETGHGLNPDAVGDAAAWADGVGVDFSDPVEVAELAALITLRARAGVELAAVDDLAALAAQVDPADAFLRTEIERHAARDGSWAGYADKLVDAAYSSEAALAHVQRRAARGQRAHGSAGALGADARGLVVALVTALVTAMTGHAGRAVVRIAPGIDTTLFDAVVRAFDGEVDIVWPAGDETRPLRRRNVCSGILVDAAVDSDRAAVVLARVPVSSGASVGDILIAADEVNLSLGPDDSAVLVGPARALVDALPATLAGIRADVLRTGRVRAVVRLDAGHVTSASREALAVWVFGPEADIALADRVTALADLTGVALTPATREDLVSDILANLGGPAAARAHAFRFARLQRTSSVLARVSALVTEVVPRRQAGASRDLSALLDAALAAAAGDAPALEVAPHAQPLAVPNTMTVQAAVRGKHARVLPGTRLSADEFGPTGLVVVTAADLDDPAAIGAHRVDQLAFAGAHPKAALTQPGDVVFRTSPSPRAWVDHDGSHVVAYPARVLRISAADPGGLVPELVVADIAGGAGGPGAWKRWRLRTIEPAQMAPLRAALAAASRTRVELRGRLDRLDDLTRILSDAVAARAVVVNDPTDR